jgi:hypothetical protein
MFDILSFAGTYKLMKRDLQLDGFDLAKVKDPLYFADPKGQFLPLTKQLQEDILAGKVRL